MALSRGSHLSIGRRHIGPERDYLPPYPGLPTENLVSTTAVGRLQFNTDNLAEKRISGIDFNVDMRLVYPTSVHAMSTSQLDIACTKENTEYLLAGWSSGLTFKTMCLSIILQVVRGSWGKTFSILPFFPENAIGEGLLTSRLSVNKLGQTHIALYAGNKGGLQFTHYSL